MSQDIEDTLNPTPDQDVLVSHYPAHGGPV
jgi:hypothetical protein